MEFQNSFKHKQMSSLSPLKRIGSKTPTMINPSANQQSNFADLFIKQTKRQNLGQFGNGYQEQRPAIFDNT